MNAYLAIALLLGLSWALEIQGNDNLRSIIIRSAKHGKRPKDRDRTRTCVVEKPKDKCLKTDVGEPPFCITKKPCNFVPKYGEQTTPLKQIFDDYEDDNNILGLFFKPHHVPDIVYKIIDLGEDFVDSIPEARVCRNPNKVCDCMPETRTRPPETCSCDRDDEPKVCTQQYKEHYDWYLVYNTKFCKPKPLIYYLLQQQGGIGGGAHGGMNQALLYSMFQKNGDDEDGKINPLIYSLLLGQGQGQAINPSMLLYLLKDGSGLDGLKGLFPFLSMFGQGDQGGIGSLPYLSGLSRHFIPGGQGVSPAPAVHPKPVVLPKPAVYPKPTVYPKPAVYPKPSPHHHHPPAQSPYIPTSNIPYWLLLSGDQEYVPCEQLEPGYVPKQHAGYNPFGIDIFNYQNHYNAQVQFAYLKVLVPDGCECERM